MPPQWIRKLTDGVLREVQGQMGLGEWSCHFVKVSGVWEVTLFPESWNSDSPAMRGSHGFAINLLNVFKLFDHVSNCSWQAQSFGVDDDLGAHLSVDGTSTGHQVWLRVLSQEPMMDAASQRAMSSPARVDLN